MDAHSNPRRALKSAQEQEDRRRRRNERDRARRAAETAEQRSERLRKRRERDHARRAAQTASESQATSQQRLPVNAKEWQLKPLRENDKYSIQSQDVMQTWLHWIPNMLYLLRKIS